MSASVTPFLRLLKPPFDSVPWDEAINGNMDTIDAFIARYMAVPNYVGAWANSVQYISGQNVLDITDATIYQCRVTHTSSAVPATFADDRATYPTYWAATTNVITGGTGNTNLTISSVTPLSAKAGDLWWDSVGGQLYILYNDGNSLQWVIANNQAGNVGEAPNDGNTYGRRNSAWTQVSTGNVGRNLIHNPLFNVAQRGAGPWTTNGYTLDRYQTIASGSTFSTTQIALADADRAAIGDEAAEHAFQCVMTGTAGAGDFLLAVTHAMEDVRRLSGKTATLSFWAKANAGTPRLGVSWTQGFGSGGSPSANVNFGAQSVTLSTTWTRYTVTVAVPSATGKTFGTTTGTDATYLWLCGSSGATNNAQYGSPGVQSYTLGLWGVQLEVGNTATPLEKPDPQQDLAKCQRFFQFITTGQGQYGLAGNIINMIGMLPVLMRAAPTYTLGATSYTNCLGAVCSSYGGPGSYQAAATISATGFASYYANFTVSADL